MEIVYIYIYKSIQKLTPKKKSKTYFVVERCDMEEAWTSKPTHLKK